MKNRSTMLVALGVVVFVLGAGIVVLSMRHTSSKAPGTQVATAANNAANTPVVVASKAIPAGTSGESIIENHEVEIRKVSASQYHSDDLVSMNALNQQAVASAVPAGQPIEASNLRLNAGTLAPPPGDESIAITLPTGAAGMAGYLQPGDNVDLYGNVTKPSVLNNGPSQIYLPCTALVESSLELLDVSNVVAPYRNNPTPAGRVTPGTVTVLLAASPDQARRLVFYADNESLYLTKASPTEKADNKTQCSALIKNPQLVPSP